MVLTESSISRRRRSPGKVVFMNTRHCNYVAAAIGISAFIITLALAHGTSGQDKAPPTQEQIGIYDSRAVAVAYAGSRWQMEKMKAMTARLKKAREIGDTNEISRLEMEGRAWQASLERQGFGTAPVDDLLIHVASEIPAVQQAAGVTRLISKWNQTELNRHPQAVRVDVTMQLVDAFQPTATQRQRAMEIQKKKPKKIKE